MKDDLNYLTISDDDLADLAQNGDSTAMDLIMVKYKPFVRSRASKMYIAGADRDDVIQEGMIGLFKAVRAFDIKRKKSFSALASVCIMSQIKDAVRIASSNKQTVLNDSLEHDDLIVNSTEHSPEKLLISREEFRELWKFMETEMTRFEREAIVMISLGYSYALAAEILGKSTKSIDGALQRARKKLEKFRRDA